MALTRDIGRQKRPNPFSSDLARANSCYAAFCKNRLVLVPSGEPAAPLMEFVHDSFRSLVLNTRFSCVGAKAAIRGGGYRVGFYNDLGSPEATAGLAGDLLPFVAERGGLEGGGRRGGGDRVGFYDDLGSPEATAGLARDLFSFVEEQGGLEGGFITFAASFKGPNVGGDGRVEEL